MATLFRDIERPSFLDPPPDGQLSLGGVVTPSPESTPSQEEQPSCEPLSDRPRTERAVEAGAVEAERLGVASARTVAVREGGATLDELLVGVWEGLSARRPVACPVCAGPMHPREGATGGSCQSCGSRLG
jgi:hypothetical protein